MKGYRDLVIWQRAMGLAEATYRVTRGFPSDERFGLTSQARRAAVSVAANIAEGYGRGTRPAYVSFVRIAQGSLKELETHLMLAERIGLCPEGATAELLTEADELGRMVRTLLTRLSPKP
ncbi:four helix bundle protein [Brevundimonas fluminis]|jgi:four helix bundle protein|uniref:four helix bundle protein n=1 Tax=Brevundimonas fluminis TaxID=2487274 RepID=UPI000F656A28|nr:four helix bundle protein [Brevundimonas fluminis]